VVATEGAISVALDIEIDQDLRIEGAARELVSRIQGMRRDAGLDVTDRVDVRWESTSERIAAAFTRHLDLIAGEVLATSVVEDATDGGTVMTVDGDPVRLRIAVSR
jgi:isoleucyl-tRNA synthetase